MVDNNIAATTNLLKPIKNSKVSLNEEHQSLVGENFLSKIGRLWQEELWYNLLRVEVSSQFLPEFPFS